MKSSIDTDLLLKEWEAFIDAINKKPSLRPVTLQAWNRCKDLGVDPSEIKITYLSAEELKQKQKANSSLIKAAAPYMDYISSLLSGKPHIVVLLDNAGWVIAECGEAEELGGYDVGLCVGASWAEENIGNNGGGTALTLGEPVLIYGIEHYGLVYHNCACFGVPIKANNGTIIGALDVSVSVEYAQPSNITLALACVSSIERTLTNYGINHDTGNEKETEEFLNKLSEPSQSAVFSHKYEKIEDKLKSLEWLLKEDSQLENIICSRKGKPFTQPYGELTELNSNRLILDSVGKSILSEIADDYLNLLQTSTAIYEKNGDYALGTFSSGWCRFLDQASRKLCDTKDNKKALNSGSWHCHESCWKASEKAIKTGQPVDVKCLGGIRLYAAPIKSKGQVVGAINFGYGDPPKAPQELQRIADKYGVAVEDLSRLAHSYDSRPPFIINIAKSRLHTSARLIGEIIERKEDELREHRNKLEDMVRERTIELEKTNQELQQKVSQLKLTREALIEQSLFLETVFKNTHSSLAILDKDFNFIRVNEVYAKADERDISDFPEHNHFEFYPSDEAKVIFEQVVKTKLPYKVFSKPFTYPDHPEKGATYWDWSLVPILDTVEEVNFLILSLNDVTEREKAQLSLRESEERFRRAFKYAAIGMALVSPGGRCIQVNPSLCKMLGYSEHEMLALTFKDITHSDDLDVDMNYVNQLLKGERSTYQMEKRYHHKLGHVVWALLSVSLVRDLQGEPLYFISQIQNITKLRQAETQIRHFFNLSQDLLCIAGLDGYFKHINQAFEKVLGYSKKEILSKPIIDFVHLKDRIATIKESKKLSTGKPTTYFENRYRCQDCTYKWLAWTAYPVPEEGLIYAVARDITEHKQMEEELKKSHRQINNILESITDAFYALDQQWRFTYLNKEAEHFSLKSREELIGKCIWDVYPQGVELETYKQFHIAMSKKVAVHFETSTVMHDKCFEFHAYPSQDGLSVYFRDITERKKAEEAVSLLAAIVESSDDAIISLSLEGAIMSWNTGAENAYGYSADEVIGRHISFLAPPARCDESIDIIKRISRGEHIESFESVRVRKDGKQIYISATVSPVKDRAGNIIGASAITRDITESKRMERELISHRSRLENLVKKRTQTIKKVNEQLRKENAERKRAEVEVLKLNNNLKLQNIELNSINKELESFSYSVSHDLRAPLRSIDGFSQALLEDYEDKLEDEGKDYLQRVRRATQRMGQLIDDLLKLSRITRHELYIEEVNLSEITEVIAKGLHQTKPERQVKFIISPNLYASGDKRLLRIVLENLLGNAWKYTSKQPSAKIEFGLIEHFSKPTYFVKDNGIGFDMSYANKLFGAFQRLHSMNEFPGTGIGLATVQRIIHRHGGQIWAESELGQGATFYFRI